MNEIEIIRSSVTDQETDAAVLLSAEYRPAHTVLLFYGRRVQGVFGV